MCPPCCASSNCRPVTSSPGGPATEEWCRADHPRAAPRGVAPVVHCSGSQRSGRLGPMPRAIWSGSISFGLVNIPVKLFNAVSRKSVSFNQIDSRTGARIKYQKVSGADGSEVPNDAIVTGYELPSDEHVHIDDEEWEALGPD